MYYVLKNPEVYQKLQAEVDAVVGRESLRPDHLSKTPYLTGEFELAGCNVTTVG